MRCCSPADRHLYNSHRSESRGQVRSPPLAHHPRHCLYRVSSPLVLFSSPTILPCDHPYRITLSSLLHTTPLLKASSSHRTARLHTHHDYGKANTSCLSAAIDRQWRSRRCGAVHLPAPTVRPWLRRPLPDRGRQFDMSARQPVGEHPRQGREVQA
jgi:hypothetical protein